MDATEHQSIGLLLRRFDFGETSQIGHLLTPTEGRISVLAKGIKKPNAYLKGPFDLFQMAKITYRRRRGSDLGLLQKYEPLTGFPQLRQRLPSLLSAFYLTELVYEGVKEEDANTGAWELIIRALVALDQHDGLASRAIVLATEVGFLEAFGFGLGIDHCLRCGRRASSPVVAIYPLEGGYICADCPRSQGPAIKLSQGDCRLLSSLGRAGPKHAPRLRLSTAQHHVLRGLMRAVFQAVFEKQIRSEPFVLNPRFGFLRPAQEANQRIRSS